MQGETGTAGAQGAAGISVSYFVDLGTWTLSTDLSVGTSDSNTFISLGTGSYTFEILVDGTFSPDTSTAMTIGMQVITSAGALDFRAFASDTAAYINSYGNRHYQFMIIGKLVCSATTTLKLRAKDQFGATRGNLLKSLVSIPWSFVCPRYIWKPANSKCPNTDCAFEALTISIVWS